MLRVPLLTLVLFAWPLATQAQTQASCTFNFFSLQTNITSPDGTPVFLQPLGIDDFGIIVGYGDRRSAGSIGLVVIIENRSSERRTLATFSKKLWNRFGIGMGSMSVDM